MRDGRQALQVSHLAASVNNIQKILPLLPTPLKLGSICATLRGSDLFFVRHRSFLYRYNYKMTDKALRELVSRYSLVIRLY